jgi:integrase
LDGRKKDQPEARTDRCSDLRRHGEIHRDATANLEYLFARGSDPIKDFRESWDLACQRAGVPDLLFPDLRRTAVRNLRRAGVSETVIMKITGHRTRSVFDRYNITDHSDTQEAGRVAENFLAREQEEVAQTMSQERKKPN